MPAGYPEDPEDFAPSRHFRRDDDFYEKSLKPSSGFGGGAGGGSTPVSGFQEGNHATEKHTPIEELNIEGLGELSMPEETENKLTKLLTQWKANFSALNTDLNQVIEKSRATRERVEKEMRERHKIFEAGL